MGYALRKDVLFLFLFSHLRRIHPKILVVNFYTPRQGAIVLTSCVSVCLLPLSRLNGQTYGPEFQHVGQVEGYLGQFEVQGHRSKVKVTRSKNVFRVGYSK